MMTANLAAESLEEADLPVDISLAADGAMTLTLSDSEGTFTAEGYLNQDGSLGVFHSLYAPAGASPNEAGVVVLVELQ